MTKRRLWPWITGLVCVAAIVALLLIALTRNVVYFRTVSEAVSEGSDSSSRFRLAGAVVSGSIKELDDGVEFAVTDGKSTVLVRHAGDPPQLFKDGAPVVVEGAWGRQSATEVLGNSVENGEYAIASESGQVGDSADQTVLNTNRVFFSDRIMIRHGNEYNPPEVEQGKDQ